MLTILQVRESGFRLLERIRHHSSMFFSCFPVLVVFWKVDGSVDLLQYIHTHTQKYLNTNLQTMQRDSQDKQDTLTNMHIRKHTLLHLYKQRWRERRESVYVTDKGVENVAAI